MNGEANWAGWLAAIALGVSAVLMAGATLIHMGSNPFGLTIICLVGAGVLWSHLKRISPCGPVAKPRAPRVVHLYLLKGYVG